MKRTHASKHTHVSYTSREKIPIGRYIKYAAGIVIGVFFICIVWNVKDFISIPVHSLGGTMFHWSGGSDVNILTGYIAPNNTLQKISILSLDQGTYRVVPLPTNTYLTYEGNYEPLRSLYAISSLSNQTSAMNMLMETFLANTDIHLDGYFFIKTQAGLDTYISLNPTGFDISKFNTVWVLSHGHTARSIIDNSYSNFSLETMRALGNAFSANTSQQVIIPNSTDFTTNNQDLVINTGNFVNDVSDNLTDSYITNEHVRISIYNASNITGEGSLLASILQAKGAVIDYVGDGTNTQTATQIYTASSAFPDTLKALQQLFPYAQIIHKSYSITSDISIVLGTSATL